MNKEVVNNKEELSIPVMIFCIVGVVLTVFGIFVLKNDKFMLKVISTEGTVTSFTIAKNGDGDVERRTVNLSYVANSGNYNATIYNYTKDINVGDKMTLYYDFLSPYSVDNKRTGYLGYIAVIIGGILVLKSGPRFYRIIKDNYL